jgi:hypothetical protein
MQEESLIEKIRNLPPEKIIEVENFVEFLYQKPPKQKNDIDESDRAKLLREIAESMMANTFTGNPPRFTREELHERP